MNKNKKKYRERYKKPEVLTAVCFLLPAVFMDLLVFYTCGKIHAAQLL